MKMTLLTVGKTGRGWVRDGMDIYSSRLRRYVRFSVSETRDFKASPAMGRDQIRSGEGELVLKALRPSDTVILLDERGELKTSAEWARNVEGMVAAGRDVVFVIGGPYGFSGPVYERADGMVSLSRMTFSHQMARVIFMEQLYRAFTIIKGEPYHHE